MLLACNGLLALNEKMVPATGLSVDFSRVNECLQLGPPVRDYRMYCMLKKNDFQRFDTVFHFICAFEDNTNGQKEDVKLTKGNSF